MAGQLRYWLHDGQGEVGRTSGHNERPSGGAFARLAAYFFEQVRREITAEMPDFALACF